MAADDLSAPHGQNKRRKQGFRVPKIVPHLLIVRKGVQENGRLPSAFIAVNKLNIAVATSDSDPCHCH